MQSIEMLFTGGTISMTNAGSGARPSLGSAELLGQLDYGESVAVFGSDWGHLPASHLTLDNVLEIGLRVADLMRDPGNAGVVVVQGTDTMEESSLSWALMGPWANPLVVTGAMRSASDPDPDGPVNLRDAIRWIGVLAERPGDVHVAMGGELHSASSVVKWHSDSLGAFRSPGAGPVGRRTPAGYQLLREVSSGPGFGARAYAAVEIGYLSLGCGTDTLEYLTRPGCGPGLVICAPGKGHTSPAQLEVATEYLNRGGVVVLCSRCVEGGAQPEYGFVGGGRSWQSAGAIHTSLSAAKARAVLSLCLAHGMNRPQISDVFAGLAQASGSGVAVGAGVG